MGNASIPVKFRLAPVRGPSSAAGRGSKVRGKMLDSQQRRIPMSTVAQAATASEIITICGHLDDGVIARILATGATQAEVLEAFTWFTADDQIGTELQHGR